MKKLTMLFLGTLLLLCPLTSNAETEDFRYLPGNMELTLAGSGSNDENFDGTTLSVEASLGYFLTEAWEVFFRQGFGYADTTGGSDWNASSRIGVDYNFDLGQFKPLIGASIGWVYGDEIKDQFIAGPEIGLKYFANESTFIYGMVEYGFLFENASDADDNFDDGRFVYTVGIGYKW
ncbi:MAG: hypothetical protein R6U27_06935 [Desulfobacterales bacterium]